MSETRICPKCGAAQAWEMWRHCACGYDFYPGSDDCRPAPEPTEPAESAAKRIVPRWVGRLVRYLLVVAYLIVCVMHPVLLLRTAMKVAFFALVVLFSTDLLERER